MAGVGDRVANYVITGVIGRGAMATVYRAHDERLNRDVALKLLDPGYSMDFIFRARFEREYRVTSQIRNDHIVPVYDAGPWNDQMYIAMALIDGPNLADVMHNEGPLDFGRVASIVSQVADALDEAHRHRVIHRDVKPANILISRHGPGGQEHVYLADFGLTLGFEGTHLTRTGGFMGTLAYSAPEQLNSAPIDGRADEYALAATTYQMLTGALPYKRDNEMALVNAHLFDPVPRVTDSEPDLPPRVDTVIARGMAKKPADRYPTASEFANALTKVSAVAKGSPRGRPSASAGAPQTSRRSAAAIAAVVLGLVAAAGIGAAVALALLGGGPSPSPTALVIGVASPTPDASAPSPSPAVTVDPTPGSSALPTQTATVGPSATPTRTPRASRRPTQTPTATPTATDTPTPTDTPPAGLPQVADGSWSVDAAPASTSGDPYVPVGEHHRRYLITSHCASTTDCRLAADTFDSDSGTRLGSITLKWDGSRFSYHGPARWYSQEGGSTCRTSDGTLVENAYATHESLFVAPDPATDSTHMSGEKTIFGTLTPAGVAAGCAPFSMTYRVSMGLS